MNRAPRAAFLAAAVLFFAAPGPRDEWFSGVPLGLWPFVVFAFVGFACWMSRDQPQPPVLGRAAIVLLALTVLKVAAGAIAPPTGWVGKYYPNGAFAGEPRRSTEFPRLAGATRIDRAIDFRDDYLPLYFFNDGDFNRGIRREVTEPATIAWTGYTHTDATMRLAASHDTTISIDGGPIATGGATLEPGEHVIDVRYTKAANTDPRVWLMGLDAVVATSPTPSWKLRLLTPLHIVGRIVDLLALAACAFVSFILLRRGEWTPARIAAIAMLLLFVAQGLIASRPLQHRAVSLSGGDDWLQYEALSRAVATGDVLMLFGRPPGQGLVLYYYPGYIYFVAAMHAVGGEDLSTVIFVQFLLLWAANVVVYRIGSRLFDPRVALAAVAALVVIEEMAFMRYYTVTLLSENLYFFTVAMTLYAFVRFVESGRRGALVACAIGAGVSALTRPAMLLYLIPAAFVVCVASFRHRRSIAAAAAAAAMFVAIWLATVSPATIRNYIAAGSPVLICDPPVAGFINYNLPPNVDAKQYPARFSSTTLSVAAILVDIAVHYPMDTLRSVTTKVGFSLGLVQWMGGKWHPELLLASAGYVIAVLLIPSARAAATWPIHAFVIAHLAGMVITMPSNYGYRLILPMYLFFPLFAARAASELASRFVR
jgi:hypothetical protein